MVENAFVWDPREPTPITVRGGSDVTRCFPVGLLQMLTATVGFDES